MPKRLTAREVEKVLTQNGFNLISQSGSHRKWKNEITGALTIVPFHAGKQIPIGTLKSIINATKLNKSVFGIGG